ncbi:MAG: hypothetical protein PHE77_01970 [Candidatus Pacebacteria bacterium]|nr:hypothetical protein [Candidatus Paceibacterota bacterium]
MDWKLLFGIIGLIFCVLVGLYCAISFAIYPKNLLSFSFLKRKNLKKRAQGVVKRDVMELLCSSLSSILPRGWWLNRSMQKAPEGDFYRLSVAVCHRRQKVATIEYTPNKRFLQQLCLRVKWEQSKQEKSFSLHHLDRVVHYIEGKLSSA